MSTSTVVNVDLQQEKDFQFDINFAPTMPVLASDEPPPLGKASGPSPVQLLTAAVANCLADSLLFALRKFKQVPDPIGAKAEAIIDRDEHNHLRVQRIMVRLKLGVSAGSLTYTDRAFAQFEDFCTVTQSVRQGIPIDIEIYDNEGIQLK